MAIPTLTGRLKSLLDLYGAKIDGWRGGAGRFRDLKIGVGLDYDTLSKLGDEILRLPGFPSNGEVTIETANIREHQDFGKHYIVVKSFWWSDRAKGTPAEHEETAIENRCGPRDNSGLTLRRFAAALTI